MKNSDRTMPSLLTELHQLEFNYADGKGIDFEPYSELLSEDETRAWVHAWTGNSKIDGSQFRVFGQDGSGGYAAFWLVRQGSELLDQPIVFFGSEGELGVVAANFGDYLWLLASGIGPYEAIAYPAIARAPNVGFTEFARRYSGTTDRDRHEVLTKAQQEFPMFVEEMRAACQ